MNVPEEFDLAGYAVDPGDGLTMRNAMTWYGDQFMAGRFIGWSHLAGVPQGVEGALNPEQRNELISFRLALLEDLRRGLCDGVLAAKGFRPGELIMLDIAAEWWRRSTVDIDENTAHGHGSLLTGILIYQGKCGIEQFSTEAPDKKTIRDFMLAYFKSAAKEGRKPKLKAEVYPACIAATQASTRQVIAVAAEKCFDQYRRRPGERRA